MRIFVSFQEDFLGKRMGYAILDVFRYEIHLFLCHELIVAAALLQSKRRTELRGHHISQSVFSFEHGTLIIFIAQSDSWWFSGTDLYLEKRELEEQIAEQLKHSSVTNVILRIATKERMDILELSNKAPRI